MDGYGVDWEVGSFEGPFCGRWGYDHGGDLGRCSLEYLRSPNDGTPKVPIMIQAPCAHGEAKAQSARTLVVVGATSVMMTEIITLRVRDEI